MCAGFVGGTNVQRSRNGGSRHRRDRLEPRQLVDTGLLDCARVRCRSPGECGLGRSASTVATFVFGVKRVSKLASFSTGIGAHHEAILNSRVMQ